jgi:hypothetical protein
MERTVSKIEDLESRIARFKQYRAENPSLDFDDLKVDALDDEELRDALQVGKEFTFQMAHLDVDAWLKDLRRDKDQLTTLQASAESITPERDAKLAELKKLIRQKVTNPTTTKEGKPNRKVLVFTAFADTAVYLYDALRDWARCELGIHSALVSGGAVENKTTYGKRDYNHILTHFSPVSKSRAKIKEMPQVMTFYYRQISQEEGRVLAEVKPQRIRALPIADVPAPQQAPIIKLVDCILAAKRQDPAADTSAWEREIDQLVYQLYGLTEEEIRVVEGKG